MNTDLRTLVRAPLDDLLHEHACLRAEAALVAPDHPRAANFFADEADKIAAEIRRRINGPTPTEPTVCSCDDMVLLPIGDHPVIELDGSHHGPDHCEPCGVAS